MIRVTRSTVLVVMLVMVTVALCAGVAGAGGTRWGIPGGKMGSGFKSGSHYGEDVFQKKGTAIRALHRGCVFRVDNSISGYNQEVTVRYAPKGNMGARWVLYGHVLQGSQRKKGSCFKRGALIAKVGSRADAMNTPPHAHVQVWKRKADATYYRNGSAINPAPVRQAYREL